MHKNAIDGTDNQVCLWSRRSGLTHVHCICRNEKSSQTSRGVTWLTVNNNNGKVCSIIYSLKTLFRSLFRCSKKIPQYLRKGLAVKVNVFQCIEFQTENLVSLFSSYLTLLPREVFPGNCYCWP
jgi:hypothetical protein